MPIVEISGIAVVFLLIVAVLVAFVTEVVPNDITAISVVAALVVLEPWTGVDARGAISGFANPATVTIIKIQAGNPAVHGGEERDTVRNNRRSVADRLPTPNATRMNVKCYI